MYAGGVEFETSEGSANPLKSGGGFKVFEIADKMLELQDKSSYPQVLGLDIGN